MAGPKKLDSDDFEYGDVIGYERVTEIKENVDLLNISVPLGEIIPIMVGIPGVPTPDPNLWQECNGSEIVNQNSPLRTVGDQVNLTPDMRDRYLKVPAIFGESGQAGGLNDSWIFRHNHAGRTGNFVAPQDGDSSGSQFRVKTAHDHTIQYDFDYAMNIEPPFITVRWFMRIQ